MDKQKDFFSKNHSRLLDFAIWSKNIAWVVLVIYILNAMGVYAQENYRQMYTGSAQTMYGSFAELLTGNPLYTFSLFTEITSVFIKGIVYFLVLKGISLGLNMIIETDLNYREQEKDEEAE